MRGAIIRALFAVAAESSRRRRRKVRTAPGKRWILRGKNRGSSLVVSLIFKRLRQQLMVVVVHGVALVGSLIFKGLRRRQIDEQLGHLRL